MSGPPVAPTPPKPPVAPDPPIAAVAPAGGGGGGGNLLAEIRGGTALRAAATVQFTNACGLWSTYETQFNRARSLKTNQQHEMRLYRIGLEHVRVILAADEHLPDDTLERLRQTFFPQLTLEELRKLGRPPWREGRPQPLVAWSRSNLRGSRGDQIVRARLYAMLPYNSNDNNQESKAIGTRKLTDLNLALTGLQKTLPMWNTASRSSVSYLPDHETDPELAHARVTGGLLWPEDYYKGGKGDPTDRLNGGTEFDPAKTQMVVPEGTFPIGADPYAVDYVSIKNGVTNPSGAQAEPGKDVLEKASVVGCLRSDWVRDVDSRASHDGFNDPHLLILGEIITVTERHPKWTMYEHFAYQHPVGYTPEDQNRSRAEYERRAFENLRQARAGDGFQVRWLKGMKKDHVYFPPISTAFTRVAGGAVDLTGSYNYKRGVNHECLNEFDQLRNGTGAEATAWDDFWRVCYAEKLGAIKACLLLRYGIQGLAGNPQNYLIELRADGRPTGRIVVRDLADYKLHSDALEVIAPLYSEADASPRTSVLAYERHTLHAMKPKTYPFETNQHDGYNVWCTLCKGDVATQETPYPSHTAPGWHGFATLYTDKTDHYSVAPMVPRNSEQRDLKIRLLRMMARWGLAHNQAYVKYIRCALDLDADVLNIDWRPDPNPGRESRRPVSPDAYADLSRANDLWRADVAFELWIGHQVEEALRREAVQGKLRDYHEAWRGGGVEAEVRRKMAALEL